MVLCRDGALGQHQPDWPVREIRLDLKCVFMRIDVSSRAIYSLVEPGSCFVGTPLARRPDGGEGEDLKFRIGRELDAEEAVEIGLVTFAPDDIDWEE